MPEAAMLCGSGSVCRLPRRRNAFCIGTGERIRGIIAGHNRNGARFDVVSNPEFLREGSVIEDFMHPNRVVIGADSDQAMAIMKDLYSPLYIIETPFVLTNVATAEMIKYASNAFLADFTPIAHAHQLAPRLANSGQDWTTWLILGGRGAGGRGGRSALRALLLAGGCRSRRFPAAYQRTIGPAASAPAGRTRASGR